MFLYNITYNIDRDIEAHWLLWMKQIHLPKVLATGYFENYKFYRLLNVKDEGITYSAQFFTNDLKKIELYLEKEAPLLIEEHNQRYRHKHVAFRTVLQEVEL
ncbi:MAG: DUF4286 family protein [Cyclobacteriaceae bacterium]|nr:DUF4286 family protein [Cyclobacteriaceae bacterium]